jgi:hypothetical protein
MCRKKKKSSNKRKKNLIALQVVIILMLVSSTIVVKLKLQEMIAKFTKNQRKYFKLLRILRDKTLDLHLLKTKAIF